MNPDKTIQRGCFIRHESENDKFTVVDYPTWTAKKYGENFFVKQNEPLPESIQSEIDFDTKEEAVAFCRSENLVICMAPKKRPEDEIKYEGDDVE